QLSHGRRRHHEHSGKENAPDGWRHARHGRGGLLIQTLDKKFSNGYNGSIIVIKAIYRKVEGKVGITAFSEYLSWRIHLRLTRNSLNIFFNASSTTEKT